MNRPIKYTEEVVQLSSHYLTHIYGVQRANQIKHFRPFLVLELEYRGYKRLFAIPQFSNIDNNRSKDFFDKILPRLQTRQGLHHGFSYSDMIPLDIRGVSRIKRPEQRIPTSQEVRQTLMMNILNRTPDRWNVKLSPKADNQYRYMYNQISQNGMSCFSTNAVLMNKAYHTVNVSIFQNMQAVLNKGLSPDQNGIRPFYEKAQNYINNYYLPYANSKIDGTPCTIKMPKFFTDLDDYIKKANSYVPKVIRKSVIKSYKIK